VRPAIITPEQVVAIRDQVLRIHHDPEGLPPAERAVPGGASSLLIDHPAVLGVLHEIIGKEVRLEAPGSTVRELGGSAGPLHGAGVGARAPGSRRLHDQALAGALVDFRIQRIHQPTMKCPYDAVSGVGVGVCVACASGGPQQANPIFGYRTQNGQFRRGRRHEAIPPHPALFYCIGN
jgi:hypothetical protein